MSNSSQKTDLTSNFESFAFSNPDIEVTSEQNVETLINLKFNVERQFSALHETFEKAKEIRLVNTNADLDIYGLVTMYTNNIEIYGNTFLEKQTELLKHIDTLLLKKCPHNWIDDVIDGPFSSRDICYCSKCYVRK